MIYDTTDNLSRLACAANRGVDNRRKHNRKLARKIKKQEEIIGRYVRADNDTAPTYMAVDTKDGHIGVCRYSMVDGFLHRTAIKIFADPDQEFNQREAEELLEKLQEE